MLTLFGRSSLKKCFAPVNNAALRSYTAAAEKPSERNVETSAMDAFASRLGLKFQNPSVLHQSLTHSSFRHGSVPHNERFEFMGDRVISLFVAENLYSQAPKLTGSRMNAEITATVSNLRFAKVARGLGLQTVVRWHPAPTSVDKAEETVIADAFEALVGAIYVDQGPQAAREFIRKHILKA
eukprot:TRINITY_DN1178_c0_g1_i2.p1 TRINITY_DN1178_c0_g1~~TRINITY_DN1178_c0_g1_i2.p1  ORF type:complete len:182 (-),score=33.92 TRINITY_DN1178_c0_g1_i2:494-1039(-)